MSWAKLDDAFYDNPKVVDTSREAIGVFVCGLSYCARHLTNGRIALAIVPSLVGPNKSALEIIVTELVAKGFWHAVSGGYLVHDYLHFNPTKYQVQKRRKDAENRKKRWANRNANGTRSEAIIATRSERVPNLSMERVRNTTSERPPDPTRPDPTRIEQKKKKTPLPPARKRRGVHAANDGPPEFIELWAMYPRKEKRLEAVKAWREFDTEAPLDKILTALEWQMRSPGWLRNGGQYIPLLASYLRGKRWEDQQLSAPIHSPSAAQASINLEGFLAKHRVEGAS